MKKQLFQNCITCNKEFNVSKFWYGKRKYCSPTCQYKGMIGRKLSLKTKQKISKTQKGRVAWNKGIKMSKEAKFKMIMAQKGRHHSPNTEFKKGQIGSKAGNWKGGRTKRDGYILIYHATHPYKDKNNYVPEHRFVMENKIGRFLKPQEVVHHINHIKNDNHIENLMYFSSESEHQKFHNSFYKCLPEP